MADLFLLDRDPDICFYETEVKCLYNVITLQVDPIFIVKKMAY